MEDLVIRSFDITLKVKEQKSCSPCKGCIFEHIDCTEVDAIPGCGGKDEHGKEFDTIYVLDEKFNSMKVFRIGLSVYSMPLDPVVGDMKALRKWRPTKVNFWKGLYMIYKYKELR